MLLVAVLDILQVVIVQNVLQVIICLLIVARLVNLDIIVLMEQKQAVHLKLHTAELAIQQAAFVQVVELDTN